MTCLIDWLIDWLTDWLITRPAAFYVLQCIVPGRFVLTFASCAFARVNWNRDNCFERWTCRLRRSVIVPWCTCSIFNTQIRTCSQHRNDTTTKFGTTTDYGMTIFTVRSPLLYGCQISRVRSLSWTQRIFSKGSGPPGLSLWAYGQLLCHYVCIDIV